MAQTFPGLTRHALNGPTMGTRWQALFHAEPAFDPAPLHAALAQAVARIDQQMSAWIPGSDLNRFSAAPPDVWVPLPAEILAVLATALLVSRQTHGAFNPTLGDSTRAWGFGPTPATPSAIAAAQRPHPPAHTLIELDLPAARARKHAPLTLDLNGIAKGHGADRLAQVLQAHGIPSGLLALDGELVALGTQPDGAPWTVAVEQPDPTARAAHSHLTLSDIAVATSGDYRHRILAAGRPLSHTMNPATGAPLSPSPASVTVLAPTAITADAWATALMVLGPAQGLPLAAAHGLPALFLFHDAPPQGTPPFA